MDFKEIIMAIIKEAGGIETPRRVGWGKKSALWKWCGGKLSAYFYDGPPPGYGEGVEFYWYEHTRYGSISGTTCRVHPSDLCNPNWSPAMLIRKINSIVASAKASKQ